MMTTMRPTWLVDKDSLVERALDVAIIADRMRRDPAWKQDGERSRRLAAARVAWQQWRHDVGELHDGEGSEG